MAGTLSIERLRCMCDPDVLGCTSSVDAEPLQTILGQVRALKALEFGLRIKEKGFNIYVAGPAGSGRKTALRKYLEDIARNRPIPPDMCYVNNFKDSYRPKAIPLPAGKGRAFKKDVDDFVTAARKEILKTFESEEYAARRNNTVKKFQQQREEMFTKLNEEAQKRGMLIQPTPMGLATIPVIDGKPLSEEDFMALDTKTRNSITRKQKRLQEQLKKAGRQITALEKKTGEMVEKLDRDVAAYTLDVLLEDLLETYHGMREVLAFLKEMRDDMVDN
ncbi:MAG: Lon-like protease helical domain-containing protein, partial [Desulfomonilia bacterium]